MPAAPYAHLYVAYGTVMSEATGQLSAGDAVRYYGVDNDHGRTLRAVHAAELLVWEMFARRGESEPALRCE